MEKVKSTKEHTIYKKHSGRFGVQDAKGNWVNGEAKIKVLLDAKLIKLTPKKKVEAPAEAAAPAEAVTETKTEEAK